MSQSEPMTGPRVLLVDAALKGHEGHHRRLALGYADVIGPDACHLAVHKVAGPIQGYEGRVHRLFPLSQYEVAEHRRLGAVGRAAQALVHTDRMIRSPRLRGGLLWTLNRVRRALGERPTPKTAGAPALRSDVFSDPLRAAIVSAGLGPDDHLVLLSLDVEMGLAALELLLEETAAELPTFHARLMYDESTPSQGLMDYAGLVERLAATGLLGSRLWLYAETAAHAAFLTQRLGRPVDLAPYPAQPRTPRPAAGGLITIGYLGEARAEKGLHWVAPTLRAFEARHPDLIDRTRWVAQAGGRSVEATRMRDRLKTEADLVHPRLDLRPGVLSGEAYQALRSEIDIVLAPQSAGTYAYRGSGVAREALAGGQPLVCRPGTALVDPDLGDATLTGDSPEALADALARIVRDFPAWKARADAVAGRCARQVESSALVRRCRTPTGPVRARPRVALTVGPWWPEGGSAQLMALQDRTLRQLGYQVVRVHLLPPGGQVAEVTAQVWRGDRRDRDAAWSTVLGLDDPLPPLLAGLAASDRLALVVANFEIALPWARRLGARAPVVLETHESGLDPFTGAVAARDRIDTEGARAVIFTTRAELAAYEASGAAVQGHYILPPLAGPLGPDPADRPAPFDLLFVGSDHDKNRRALARLCHEVLDEPMRQGLILGVAGGVSLPQTSARLVALGRLPSLEAAYQAAALVVVPQEPEDGGVPTKLMAAMARARPVIADVGAVRALGLDETVAFSASDAATFRRMIRRAMEDPTYRQGLAEAAAQAWRTLGSEEAYRRRWSEILDGLGLAQAARPGFGDEGGG